MSGVENGELQCVDHTADGVDNTAGKQPSKPSLGKCVNNWNEGQNTQPAHANVQHGTLYTGWTNCLEKRLKAHNSGKNGAKYTKTKRPVTLVYYEGYATKEEAMSREYAIKQLTRAKKFALMEF